MKIQIQNTSEEIEKILKQDKRFLTEDNKLIKSEIIEKVITLDTGLIKLLTKNARTLSLYFKDIEGTLVFDKQKFLDFVNSNEFLPKSYTAFENQLGLSGDNRKLMINSHEVVLNFPYKDCILEGGQEKTDKKIDEVFYNNILAPDEIDKLKAPKVMTNWKMYNEKGVHEVKEISSNDNLIIRGNNLLGLYSLLPKYRGQVKLIYIDPPYNTGTDDFKYNDKFNHSTWLVFMKNRLEVAKDLLKEDGFIFVQCDDNEQAYLKVLMDEVFNDLFLTTVCVQMSYASGEKMAHIDKKPPKIKEYIHIYTKSKGLKIKPQYTEGTLDGEYNKFIEKNNSDKVENWNVVNLQDIFKKLSLKEDDEKEAFMLENANLIFNRVRNKSDIFKNTSGNKKLVPITTATGLKKYAWNGREVVFLSDRIVTDYLGNKTYQQAIGDIWSDVPIVSLYLEGNVELLGGKKPEFLIRRIIDMVTKEGDLVLDYHLGSGTTCAVAHKMNRRYIGIEQLDYGDNDSVSRLNNVIQGDQTGISKLEDWKGGGSFVYAEIMQWNEKYVQRINEGKTSKDLEKIYKDMQKEAFFRYDISLEKFKGEKAQKSFAELLVADQKQALVDCLDINHLYVNFNDIEDSVYKVDKKDIELNKKFYK